MSRIPVWRSMAVEDERAVCATAGRAGAFIEVNPQFLVGRRGEDGAVDRRPRPVTPLRGVITFGAELLQNAPDRGNARAALEQHEVARKTVYPAKCGHTFQRHEISSDR